MAAKDFTEMNTGRVFSALETATSTKRQQAAASPKEQAERMARMKTQGRKGCKAVRINLAFTPDNHEFIRTMAKATGKTMTEFANLVISAYRAEHPELMEKANDFLATVNAGILSSLAADEAT